MIKFWAFIYRLTGWYSPFAKLAGYKFMMKNIKQIEAIYRHEINDMSLETHIKLSIALWEAEHGFVIKGDKAEKFLKEMRNDKE